MAVAPLAILGSACGSVAQYTYGFTETETRSVIRTNAVRVNRPLAAQVERVEPDGTRTPIPGSHDLVTFEVEETVEAPRGLAPLYVGTVADAAVAIGLGALYLSDDQELRSSIYQLSLLGAASGFIADLAFSIYYANQDREPEAVRYRPVDPKPVTYVATLGDEVRSASVEAALEHRVELDFSDLDTSTTAIARVRPPTVPGGPRLPAAPDGEATSSARFDDLTKPAPPPVEEVWYGWQTLFVEVAALSVLAYGATNEDTRMIGVGIGAHVLAPSLVHAAHGRVEEMGGSIGLHLGPTAGGAAVGAAFILVLTPFIAILGEGGELPGLFAAAAKYGAATGFLLGAPVAAILDVVALSWEPVESKPELQVTPTASWTDDGHPTFGFAGRF